MIYKYFGADARSYRLWRYYMHLATKSRTVESMFRWTALAKRAIDGS